MLEKYRFEEQLGQQMKLIDYLHELWKDNNKKKVGLITLIQFNPIITCHITKRFSIYM